MPPPMKRPSSVLSSCMREGYVPQDVPVDQSEVTYLRVLVFVCGAMKILRPQFTESHAGSAYVVGHMRIAVHRRDVRHCARDRIPRRCIASCRVDMPTKTIESVFRTVEPHPNVRLCFATTRSVASLDVSVFSLNQSPEGTRDRGNE